MTSELRWLVDRALISDLLVEFARRLDLRDWDGCAELYTVDGDGDTARTRSSLFAVHVLGDRGLRHADGAGWYDNSPVRTEDGRRFTAVRVRPVWPAGEPLLH